MPCIQTEHDTAIFGTAVKYFQIIMLRDIYNFHLWMIPLYFIMNLVIDGTVSAWPMIKSYYLPILENVVVVLVS